MDSRRHLHTPEVLTAMAHTEESHGSSEAIQMVHGSSPSIPALSTQPIPIVDLRDVASSEWGCSHCHTESMGGDTKSVGCDTDIGESGGDTESDGNQVDWILERDTMHAADAAAMDNSIRSCARFSDTESVIIFSSTGKGHGSVTTETITQRQRVVLCGSACESVWMCHVSSQ